MADNINGRVWALDTAAGIVSDIPVYICGIAVTWKVASAGAIVLSTFAREDSTAMIILDAITLGAASAGVDQMTQWFPIDGVFEGLQKVTMTQIAKLYIYTK